MVPARRPANGRFSADCNAKQLRNDRLECPCYGSSQRVEGTFRRIFDCSEQIAQFPPKINYFVRCSPTMLLFKEDLGARNRIEARSCVLKAWLG